MEISKFIEKCVIEYVGKTKFPFYVPIVTILSIKIRIFISIGSLDRNRFELRLISELTVLSNISRIKPFYFVSIAVSHHVEHAAINKIKLRIERSNTIVRIEGKVCKRSQLIYDVHEKSL